MAKRNRQFIGGRNRTPTITDHWIFGLIIVLVLGFGFKDILDSRRGTQFQATTLAGTPISFPSDFKGKVVLLDFWATWCGPCMAEAPNVVANYNRFHSKGLEVVGISLDDASTMNKISEVTKENGMTWPQICDGSGWSSSYAKMFRVDSIPHAFLIDGSTGKILADGDAVRGDRLTSVLADELEKKSG